MLRIFRLLGLAFVILFGLVPVDLSSASAADDAAPKSAEIAHDAKKEAHKSEAHHEEIGESGVNIDPSHVNPDLSIYTFVVFLLLLAVLWRFAWGPISKGLEKREAGIRQNIAAAEQARIKAEQMLAEHAARLDKVQDEVREIVAEARRDAEHVKREIVSEAQTEAEATKKRSIQEIERAKDSAIKELFDVLAGQVASATEHVLARTLSDQDRNRLIDEALAQLPRNGK